MLGQLESLLGTELLPVLVTTSYESDEAVAATGLGADGTVERLLAPRPLRDLPERVYSASATFSHNIGIPRLIDLLVGDRGCLFTFHRVAHPRDWSGLPHKSFYLDTGFLGRLIEHLTKTNWEIVTMDDVVDRMRTRRPGRFVNFSIDDGYRDTWEVATPVFRSFGVPFTVYVTTGIPDDTYVMWTSGLEQIIREREWVNLPGREHEGIVVPVRTEQEKTSVYRSLTRTWESADPVAAYRQFCSANSYDIVSLHNRHAITWDMLEALRDEPLAELGAHTISHPRLSCLSASDALAELAGSRLRLGTKLGVQIRHLAFPYGRSGDCSERDFRLAEQSGYSSASTTRRGLLWAKRKPNVFALPRINLNGSHNSLAHVEAHLSGLSSLLASAAGRV